MVKKDFSAAPAINTFISNTAEIEEQKTSESEQQKPLTTEQNNEATFQYSPQKKEIKNKRLQLVVTPTLYRKIKSKARENNTSMNDLICQLIDQIL